MKNGLMTVIVVIVALLAATLASPDSDAQALPGRWVENRNVGVFEDANANSYLRSDEDFLFFYDMHVKAGGQWYGNGKWDGWVCGQYFRNDGYRGDWKCANGWAGTEVHIEGIDTISGGNDPLHTMRINSARKFWDINA